MAYEIDEDLLREVLYEKEWAEAIIISDDSALKRIISIVGQWWEENKNNKKLGKYAFPRKLNSTVRGVLYHAPRKAKNRYKDLTNAYFQAELANKRVLEKAARKVEEEKRQPSFNFG